MPEFMSYNSIDNSIPFILTDRFRYIAGMTYLARAIIYPDFFAIPYLYEKRGYIRGCIAIDVMLPVRSGMDNHKMCILSKVDLTVTVGDSKDIPEIFLYSFDKELLIIHPGIVICHLVRKSIGKFRIILPGIDIVIELIITQTGCEIIILKSLHMSGKEFIVVWRSIE